MALHLCKVLTSVLIVPFLHRLKPGLLPSLHFLHLHLLLLLLPISSSTLPLLIASSVASGISTTLFYTTHSGFIHASSPDRRSVQQSRLLQAHALGTTLAGGLLISSLFLKTIPGLPPLLPLSVPNQTDTHPSSPLPSLLSSSMSNQALSYKSFGGGTLEEAAGGKNYSATTFASHEDTR